MWLKERKRVIKQMPAYLNKLSTWMKETDNIVHKNTSLKFLLQNVDS